MELREDDAAHSKELGKSPEDRKVLPAERAAVPDAKWQPMQENQPVLQAYIV